MGRKWMLFGCAVALLSFSGMALADQGRGHDRDDDRDHGHGRHYDHDRDHDGDRHYYSEHDRDYMRHWYHDHDGHLPPGLAKRDHLPPGLERQLMVRGTLPPGLRRHMEPCPKELERELPPPPPHCAHVLVGGHIVLMNRANFMVLDIMHFE